MVTTCDVGRLIWALHIASENICFVLMCYVGIIYIVIMINSSVWYSKVTARWYSKVTAMWNCKVTSRWYSKVTARWYSKVTARWNCKVTARWYSKVTAR